MRKLAIAAVSFSAAIFAANYILSVKWLIVPAVVFALAGGALASLHEKWPKGLIIALISAALGLVNYYVQYQLTYAAAQSMAGETAEITARITSYPSQYASYCKMEAVPLERSMHRHKVIIYDNQKACANAIPGQIISLTAEIRTADTFYGEKTDYFNAKDIYLKLSSKGEVTISGGWDIRAVPAYIGHWFAGKIDQIFPDDTQAFMKSLMLGDKDELYDDEALHLHLTRAGFMHIVAVSGMHIAFLVGLIQLLLGVGRRSSTICIALIWLFTLVTGASPSTVRASVMQTILLTAPLVYRENDPVTSLSAALGLILFINPFAAASVSLQLSFGAMAGIILFAKPIYDYLVKAIPKKLRGGITRYVLSTAASSLGVMAITVPLTAIHFGYVPLLSALSNIAALWSVSYCFCGGWIACALSVLQPLGNLAAWLCSWVARYIFLVAGLISDVPFAVVYMQTRGAAFWLIVTYATAAFFAVFRKKIRFKVLTMIVLSTACLTVVLTASAFHYGKGTTVTAVNVGQGQSLAVFSDDATVVIDCGSSSGIDAGQTAGEYLISCGRRKIDALVLTHLHEDHANGVTMLMEMLPVDNVILPQPADTDSGIYRQIAAAAKRHGTKILAIEQDCAFDIEKIRTELYAPEKGDSDNESCLMIKLSAGGADLLITGDSSGDAEERLAREQNLVGTDILIVGHHGSKYSSNAQFLQGLGAKIAVISVGYNTYGHPAEETLERLEANGYNILRTDLDGTIELRLD